MIMKFKDLVIPNKLQAESSTLTDFYGKFIAGPFEGGYGHTIGNSLRRLLLSSMEGSAIVGVSGVGVSHEYAVLEGVKEDMMQVILNLKQVRFRSHSHNNLQKLSLSKKGEGVVRAGDIIENSNIEVVNKDLVIANLDFSGSLDLELYIERGRGFVAVEDQDKSKFPENVILVDTIFTPVIRVNYHIEDARVENITDYDRLIIEIWTDGTVKPEDALAYAAKILKDSMDIFINFEDEDVNLKGYFPEEEQGVEEEDTDVKLNNILNKSVDIIELSVRSSNCLKSAKISTIKELVEKKESELLNYKNFGRKSLDEIKEKLIELGLSLGMKI